MTAPTEWTDKQLAHDGCTYVPPLWLPDPIPANEFVKHRNRTYLRGEIEYIRQVLGPLCPHDPEQLWAFVYTSVIILTHKIEVIDTVASDEKHTMSWFSLCTKAEIWLGRLMIKPLPHRGRYQLGGFTHTIPKEFYYV